MSKRKAIDDLRVKVRAMVDHDDPIPGRLLRMLAMQSSLEGVTPQHMMSSNDTFYVMKPFTDGGKVHAMAEVSSTSACEVVDVWNGIVTVATVGGRLLSEYALAFVNAPELRYLKERGVSHEEMTVRELLGLLAGHAIDGALFAEMVDPIVAEIERRMPTVTFTKGQSAGKTDVAKETA